MKRTAIAVHVSALQRLQLTNEERFEKYIKRAEGCWEWKGGPPKGYGSFSWRFEEGNRCKPIGAHRASYMLHKGPIPKGKFVRHTCDNKRCVNPAHLVVGTQADNMRDCKDRRRTAKGERHHHAVMTRAKVEELRQRYADGERQVDLAEAFGIAQPTVSQIVRGVTWT